MTQNDIDLSELLNFIEQSYFEMRFLEKNKIIINLPSYCEKFVRKHIFLLIPFSSPNYEGSITLNGFEITFNHYKHECIMYYRDWWISLDKNFIFTFELK